MRTERAKHDHAALIRLKAAHGWRHLPLDKMVDLREAAQQALAARIPIAGLTAEDHARIVDLVFVEACELTAPSGGNFPRTALLGHYSWWDRAILSAMQRISEERNLTIARAILTAIKSTLDDLQRGLLAIAEAAKR